MRDIGRAMVWLGTYQEPENDNNILLLKGFDTTWNQLKTAIDNATRKISKTMHLPKNLTEEQMIAYKLTPFAVKTFTVELVFYVTFEWELLCRSSTSHFLHNYLLWFI